MKLVRCEWAPSLVVEWLCGELEERGIPGPTYAHTLLSLLHHHYCPHPAPTTPISATTCSGNATGHYYHPLSRRHLDDFDLRDLDLDDLLGHTTHPDADLPDLSSFTPQQRGGSRRARKRHKVRQKHRILTSEQLQKVAALQCLMSASDERYDLESLVEELCSRLKTAAENEHLNVTNSTPACGNKDKCVTLNAVSHDSSNETDDYASSTPEEQAEKYYAAFPPLSGSCKENCVREKPWKSGDAFCSCVWEGKKSSFAARSEAIQTSTIKMPRTHRKKCREKEKKDVEAKFDGIAGHEGSRRPHVSFTWHTAVKHKEAHLSESYDTDSASEPERNVERRRKKFMGPLLDEDIGEGYIGDTSSRESSEDRDKGDQDLEKSRDDKSDKTSGPLGVAKGKMSQEEWECMGDLLLGASDNEGDSLHGGGGSRLFERGSTSGGTSGSSSDVETQEAESVRQLERKISDSVAQVWGQVGESLGHGRGEHVWDPPAVQEMALYTTIWGFNLPEQLDTHDSISLEHGHCNEVIQEPFTPINDDWQQSHSWHAINPSTEEDPLLCSISGQSPLGNFKETSLKEANTLLHLHNSLEKSIWSDCNANNISGSEGSVLMCMDDHQINNTLEPYGEKEAKCHATEELENKLCESFMQLGLENIWDKTLGLESVFAELSLSNSNLECVSENNSFEEIVHDSQTDSEHEKMMALVEDVCKSYESQEEAAPDSSVVKQMPSGPSGPQADLRHTESSGFSMVVPRGKSVEPNSSLEQLSETLLMGLGSKSVSNSGGFENTDVLPPAQEEENLLTSPRTHFRPIRQDSIGSTADDHYEDGTMFIVNSERPDLPFQRTSSGALFLESDLLEGSPKKYMVYKEPVPKLIQTEEESEVVAHESFQAIALVPKFKVVNNEKFCQTEEESLPSGIRSFCINVEKVAPYEKVCLTDRFKRKEDEQEPDVFEFQQQDFPDSNNLASLWKNGPQSSEAGYSRNIWQIEMEQDRENSWPQLNDIEGGGITGNAWLEREGEGATGWSSEGHFEPPPESNINQKSEAVVIPTSLASLWHHRSSPTSPTIPSSMTSLQALWTGCTSRVTEDSELDTNRANMYIITNPTTYIPGKLHDNCHMMSGLTEVGPWKHAGSVEKCVNNKKDQIWLENCLLSNKQKQQNEDLQKRSVAVGAHIDAPGACTELRLEVDQEADELLGAVHAQTASSQNLHTSHQPVITDTHSPQPLHERLKKCSSGNPVSKTANSDNPLCRTKIVPHEDTEREDLDDLAPGWEFNDGFEWGPQAVGAHEVEDCPDGLGEDEDGEGGEVFIYETDGITYTIPVEYLDDSLYDQIFGTSDSATQRLGGSLPDLPLGEPTAIRFSSELEDEWKRSGIPYKVQLPRKPRPGRWLPPSRRPCTFFMEGSCRRSDCKFSHDLASITCRFWEEGSCLKGITCPFLHGYPLRRRRNKSEGAAHSEGEKPDHHSSSFEIDSEMDFPTLGSSCESKMGGVDERNYMTSGIGSNGSHQAVARKKKRKFITITKNVLGEVKNAETDRALRRIARRERRRRHTEITAATTDLHTATSTSNEPPPTQHNLRKAKRHRASASGHDDGTVSDY